MIVCQKKLLEQQGGHILFVPVLIRNDKVKKPHLTQLTFVPFIVRLNLIALRKANLYRLGIIYYPNEIINIVILLR